MESIDGKKIYLKTVEEKILTAWLENKSKRISVRDGIRVGDLTKIYTLWNTNLVSETVESHEVRIHITGNDDMDDRYYRYGRPKDVIMTQTTKSRLNAFLLYYGFERLEVHSSKKEWCVRHKGKELSIDSWYKLDFDTKTLVKC